MECDAGDVEPGAYKRADKHTETTKHATRTRWEPRSAVGRSDGPVTPTRPGQTARSPLTGREEADMALGTFTGQVGCPVTNCGAVIEVTGTLSMEPPSWAEPMSVATVDDAPLREHLAAVHYIAVPLLNTEPSPVVGITTGDPT